MYGESKEAMYIPSHVHERSHVRPAMYARDGTYWKNWSTVQVTPFYLTMEQILRIFEIGLAH